MAIQLIMTYEDGTKRFFDLHQDRTTIGSRRSCDLHVSIPTIAPVHCEITIKDGLAEILNCDPDSDTFRNNQAISSATLEDEDIVRIGPVEFTVKMNNDETIIRRL
ncbi:MAG TPA: FHA domain-containing protein [Phycisphaerales bacterium]|nr:FHA domain-containing protein [Phycisphaerales bacterium]HIB01371.1 FHA domain-containing protein [Phycisphaerales bacterium]HIB50102.1 FHA domain-containing protein [Phycisphaerales bacterium]HIN84620.1 FHA domain-containing protein [Phycisphaerales bacterium]HIO53064.1 FHA domain-containing protein [Phycisphaerales bacterium]